MEYLLVKKQETGKWKPFPRPAVPECIWPHVKTAFAGRIQLLAMLGATAIFVEKEMDACNWQWHTEIRNHPIGRMHSGNCKTAH